MVVPIVNTRVSCARRIQPFLKYENGYIWNDEVGTMASVGCSSQYH